MDNIPHEQPKFLHTWNRTWARFKLLGLDVPLVSSGLLHDLQEVAHILRHVIHRELHLTKRSAGRLRRASQKSY